MQKNEEKLLNMEHRIVELPLTKLIGKRLTMSLANDRTYELWHSFMPRRNEIKNNVGSDLVCMQIYNPSLEFINFNKDTELEKWAAIEVSDFSNVPQDMETYTLQGGLFVVFNFKGGAKEFSEAFQFILTNWLPNSVYEEDKREHFQLLGEKYKNNHPDSEEELWIPIKRKK